MAASKRYRARSGSGTGVWRAWLTAAILSSLVGGLAPASAEETPCPKSKVALFHTNEGWTKLTPEAAKEIKILAIGSSSTAGIGASTPLKTYPAQLQAALSGRLGSRVKVMVENAGVSGETADATELRLEKAVASGDYDFVVWQVGTNDALAGSDPEVFRTLLQRGIAAAKRTAAHLVLLNQQYFPGIADVARYETFVGLVDSIGKANSVPVFSRYAMMKGWAADSAQVIDAMLYTDHFHMSDRGYSCVAEALAENIYGAMPETITADNRPATAPAVKSKLPVVPASVSAKLTR